MNLILATFGYNTPEDYGPYTVAVANQPGTILGHRIAQSIIQYLESGFQDSKKRVEIPVEIILRQ